MTQTLTTDELRQIVDSHEKGYGMSVPINYGYLAARELLANREAQPVRYLNKFSGVCVTLEQQPNAADDFAVYAPLYATPPAPAVPDEMTFSEAENFIKELTPPTEEEAAMFAWNSCRAAMLAQPVSPGYKLVPVEPTEDMQIAAREWSRRKYGIPIGSDASIGCYEAMLAAAPEGGNG